ncbi:hypothetical protein ASG39_18420 [Rhizobium sp. Leaf371]|uniref:hypothetical protein n=1 Tax=Rhizobium sp. Leaf371 TaxID=1736355 RepID=UPI0007148778|nr:hypothetical protein [Rhizobium sp. Leaf371]KQS59305.1 hypothetical protein ASG39_18420 [Rhizobium sp. Leaf371]
MTFKDDLQNLMGTPVSQSKYIYGSIFHLMFNVTAGDAELVCNGCQWVLLDAADSVRLHDEAALSSDVISGLLTGKRLRSVESSPGSLSLHFDDVVLCGFATEDYHLMLHDGVSLKSPEWLAETDAARDSFMLFRPDGPAAGYEFSGYFDLNSVPWGAHYLSAQEGIIG